MTIMSDKEVDEAAKALMQWFRSQNISPADAGAVMIKVIATCLTMKTRNPIDLGSAIVSVRQLLVLEVAECLR